MNRTLMLVAAGISLLAWSGCSADKRGESKQQTAPKTVRVVTAVPAPGSSYTEIMGTITARRRAEIETKVQSRVDHIPVAIGTRVHEGDLMVEFDTRETRARVQQARALSEQAAADLRRFEILLSQGAVTQQEYDAVKARKTVADAGLQEAEALLTYARISAPFSGTITRKDINEGDLAVPGRPLLTLEDESELQLVAAIPESQRSRVRIGDTLSVRVDTAHSTSPAVVEELSPSADPMSRSTIVKLALPDDQRFYAGQFARILIPASSEPSISVPASAVIQRGQLELVFVADDDGRASLKMVRTGRKNDDQIEILAGLRGGEKVIMAPSHDLAEHDRVEVAP